MVTRRLKCAGPGLSRGTRCRTGNADVLGTHDPPTHAGADKGYDEAAFIADVRQLNFTPHVAPNVHARRSTSPVDGRTTRHAGYAASPRKRKLVEEGSGWGKCAGLLRKLHHRGRRR